MNDELAQVRDELSRHGEACGADQPHCESCGNTDSDDLDTGADPAYQGYTRCCNELVCHDDTDYQWFIGETHRLPDPTNPRYTYENHVTHGTVHACCGYRADLLAQTQNLRVLSRVP